MAAGKSTISKTAVWILLGLLFVALAGFGANSVSGNIRTIGFAGDQPISVNAYVREMQQELSQLQRQLGRAVPMSDAIAAGIDQRVLQRLITQAALDQEAADLGLSVGDEVVRNEILDIRGFQGLDGQFDRDAYRFALDRVGLSEADFEADLRRETARELVQGAVIGGTRMPDIMTDTLIRYVAARRSFTWAALTADDLDTPIEDPTGGDVQMFYDMNQADFMLPETKRLRFIRLTPDMMLDDVDVDESAVRQLFDERKNEYELPERRLVERLVFSDDSTAESAKAQVEVGGTSFEQLVQERGLVLADVDLGDVTRDDLEDAAEQVFTAEQGAVVGPLPTSLGPALFRINGVLAAQTTAFEDVRDQLRDELAGANARRQIEVLAEEVDNLLAAGATLEEIAAETPLELGELDWFSGSDDGLAAYTAFSEVAARVTEEDYAEVIYLRDDGIAALELIEVLPARPEPLDEARDRVVASLKAEEVRAALQAKVDPIAEDLRQGGTWEDAGLTPSVEEGQTRSSFIEGAPAGFVTDIFEMDIKDVAVVPNGAGLILVKLDAILPPEEDGDVAAIRQQVAAGLNQSLAQALFAAYVRDVQLRVRPQIDQRALAAVQSSFSN